MHGNYLTNQHLLKIKIPSKLGKQNIYQIKISCKVEQPGSYLMVRILEIVLLREEQREDTPVITAAVGQFSISGTKCLAHTA